MNPSLSLLDNMLGSLDELFPNSIQINNKWFYNRVNITS
jgi:hypothetical protein